jgi:hypothetical protein
MICRMLFIRMLFMCSATVAFDVRVHVVLLGLDLIDSRRLGNVVESRHPIGHKVDKRCGLEVAVASIHRERRVVFVVHVGGLVRRERQRRERLVAAAEPVLPQLCTRQPCVPRLSLAFAIGSCLGKNE